MMSQPIVIAHWSESAPQPDHPNATMWLFLGDGKGGFARTEIATGYGVHEAKVGDLDGDGKPDILAKPYCRDTPRIDVWLQEHGE
jgi:hypothetical protein